MLKKRIIPCLDIKSNRVVKGVNFLNLKDAGDPVELAKFYYAEGADELVFLDITASVEKRKTLIELVKKVAKEIFIPFTVGGGIDSIELIREILENGADKISLNSAAVNNPDLINEASRIFGAQAIVVAIDVKKTGNNYKVFVKSGTENTGVDALEWAKEVEQRGAGEILLTSMDRDGTKSGFDNEITRMVSEAVNIPVIASGGAGSVKDLKEGFQRGKADGVLAASILHYKEVTISKIKKYLTENNINVRI
jgi:cyclase